MKKGFTLAELLGVIIILGIVALISIPLINKMIKDSKTDAYNAQVKIIVEAAKTWALNNTTRLPDVNSDNEETVSVAELITAGYIKGSDSDQIINPTDETKTMNGCVIIKYSQDYQQYTYEYIDECQN